MTGLIAKKIGMSQVFRESGEAMPVTYLEVEPNTVVRMKTKEKDGYDAVILGVGAKTWRTRKGRELVRYKHLKEWAVETLEGWSTGKTVTVESIPAESTVSICGVSKGKGFQGVVKRHGFAEGPYSHGSHHHREGGSVGMRESPGRIIKGKRMAGHMGMESVTLKNLPVLVCDPVKGVLGIKGPIPGPNGAAVYITLESNSKA